MLKICSNYPQPLWVAIMYYEPGCSDGGDWIKKGWWRLTSGQCAIVYGGDLDDLNQYYYYYAESEDFATTWNGPINRFVPFQAFEWCEWTACSRSDGRPCGYDVGFRLLDIGDYDDYTLTLIP
jgi:uncharacterized membrane protein